MVEKSPVIFSTQSVPRDSLLVEALVAQSLFLVHLSSACAAVVLLMNKIAHEHRKHAQGMVLGVLRLAEALMLPRVLC